MTGIFSVRDTCTLQRYKQKIDGGVVEEATGHHCSVRGVQAGFATNRQSVGGFPKKLPHL